MREGWRREGGRSEGGREREVREGWRREGGGREGERSEGGREEEVRREGRRGVGYASARYTQTNSGIPFLTGCQWNRRSFNNYWRGVLTHLKLLCLGERKGVLVSWVY